MYTADALTIGLTVPTASTTTMTVSESTSRSTDITPSTQSGKADSDIHRTGKNYVSIQ